MSNGIHFPICIENNPKSAVAEVYLRMKNFGDAPAFFFRGSECSYKTVVERVDYWVYELIERGVRSGDVCSVIADYSPTTFSILFALARLNAIAVPLSRDVELNHERYHAIAGSQWKIRIDSEEKVSFEKIGEVLTNPLVSSFRTLSKPGLIVFTSGSSGTPKGILHDFDRVVSKFVVARQGWRTILFLTFDHFGGLNTLLSSVAYGGVGICLERRAPDHVCAAIQSGRATLLPTTPTFLNLLLLSGCHKHADLSSIRLITYGTEVMSETTLNRVRRAFPNAEIKQTYGMSELGVLRSKSERSDSTWVKIGGDGFRVKVVDNVLWIKSQSNMVGYLNAPSPFDADGWFCTQDQVEVRDGYFRILGRKSDIITVGGEKVFPLEVETVLLAADNVMEVSVFGAPHPIMGKVVHARVTLGVDEDVSQLNKRLRSFCVGRLERYKIPVRFFIVYQSHQYSDRFKKVR
jgi:long-chain acyl-CoA synthetase